MSNFENVVTGVQNAPADNAVQKKPSAQERIDQRTAALNEAAMKAVSDKYNFQSYLTVQSRFGYYSANNNLLIFAQRPDATRIKGFDLWNKEKARVKTGAKAIYIYEPKKVNKDGNEYVNFERKAMFDIADVNGAQPVVNPAYTPHEVVQALFKHKTVAVKTVPDYPNDRQFGALYDSNEKCVYAKAGMNDEQIFISVAVALAHAEMARKISEYVAGSHAYEACCAAYILAKKYGVPTDSLHVEKIPAEYASMDAVKIRESLSRINEATKALDNGIYTALVKDKDISPKTQNEKGGDAR